MTPAFPPATHSLGRLRAFSYPQAVDRACGRRCGPVRTVARRLTNGHRPSSTWRVDSRWKTRGYPGGWMTELSVARLTVDKYSACRLRHPQAVHGLGPVATSQDCCYPQIPQDRRRRWVFSLEQTQEPSAVWTCAAGSTGEPQSATRPHPGSRKWYPAGQNQNLPAGGIA
jgi:hypothetical protein